MNGSGQQVWLYRSQNQTYFTEVNVGRLWSMPHIESELEKLRKKLMEMWDVLGMQLQIGQEAMMKPT